MVNIRKRAEPTQVARRWSDPFERVFDEFLRDTGLPEWFHGERGFVPAIDVVEEQDRMVVRADMPGMSKDDIEVTLHDNMLFLKGEKKQEEVSDRDNVHRVERRYGRFERAVALPDYVDADKITASYKDGVLTLSLPKSPGHQPKQIKIS